MAVAPCPLPVNNSSPSLSPRRRPSDGGPPPPAPRRPLARPPPAPADRPSGRLAAATGPSRSRVPGTAGHLCPPGCRRSLRPVCCRWPLPPRLPPERAERKLGSAAASSAARLPSELGACAPLRGWHLALSFPLAETRGAGWHSAGAAPLRFSRAMGRAWSARIRAFPMDLLVGSSLDPWADDHGHIGRG
jgi:hypothetical protein